MYLQEYCETGDASNSMLETMALESEAQVHHFVNEKNELKYTPLHVAIFARYLNLDIVFAALLILGQHYG